MTRTVRVLAWSAAATALVAVFALYLEPRLVVDLATRLWACF